MPTLGTMLRLPSAGPGPLVSTPRRLAATLPRLAAVLVPAYVPRTSDTRRRLGAVLIAAVLGAFAITDVAGAPIVGLLWAAHGAVLGVLFGLAWRARASAQRAALLGLVAGAMLTFPRWSSSGWAAVAQAVSTGAVCMVAAQFTRHATGREAGAPTLRRALCTADYPLVAAAALATPCVWLSAALGPRGVWAAGAAATFGGCLLASARVGRGPAARGGHLATAALVMLWVSAALMPLVVRDPRTGGIVTAVAAAVSLVVAARLGRGSADRRMERAAIVAGAPALALAAGALLSVDGSGAGAVWSGAWLALSLLAGHVAAQVDGRVEWAARIAWRRLGPWAAALAVTAEIARAMIAGEVPEPWRALAAFAAARVGAELYHAHRAHVRALRASGAAQPRVLGAERTDGEPAGGYIRRPWQPPRAACSTPAQWSAPSSAWPTKSSN